MSLFGGDDVGNYSQDVSMNEISESGDDMQPAPKIDNEEPASTSRNQNVKRDSSNSESESKQSWSDSDDKDSDEERPNKFKGPPRTWYRHTAEERRIYASLEQVRATELNVHLYNTCALKQRLRLDKADESSVLPWQHKNRWIDPAKTSEWRPSEKWTAWPLPFESVPAFGEAYGKSRPGGEEGTLRSIKNPSGPGEELKEFMLSHVLKSAREKWESREWDSDEEFKEQKVKKKRKIGFGDKDPPIRGSATVETHTPTDGSDEKAENSASESSTSSSYIADRKQAAFRIHDSSSEDEKSTSSASKSNPPKSRSSRSRSRSRKAYRSDTEFVASPSDTEPPSPRAPQFSRPVISADEDRARRILEPSLQSITSKLDTLLLALHHSRTAHEPRDEPSSPPAQEEEEHEVERAPTPNHPSRSRGRPSKTTKPIDNTEPRLKRGGGRPSIYPKPLPGESYYMMRQRVALEAATLPPDPSIAHLAKPIYKPRSRSQHNTSPLKDTRSNPSRSASPSKRPGTGRSISTTSSASTSGRPRHGLRDWSEVLGMAALTGWDNQVIERTARRCAALFGENMAFRTMEPGLGSTGEEEEAFMYTPEQIPSLSELNAETDGNETEGEEEEEYARPPFDPSSLRCPHTGCSGHEKDFPIAYRVVEHIKRVHGYDPREYAEEQESEMEGGVHVDGFLKPIPARRGWRSRDVGVRKRTVRVRQVKMRDREREVRRRKRRGERGSGESEDGGGSSSD